MSNDLTGKVALVTGAASGIGRALVARLLDGGADVLACDINADALVEMDNLERCTTRVVDVTDEAANHAMVAAAVDSLGGLDMVFLNAGVLGRPREDHREPYTAHQLNLDQYRTVRSVNTDSVVYGTVAASTALNAGGAIIATASTAGLVGWQQTPFYTATKHAVVGWVRATADALAAQGATINAICPGGVATPLVGMTAEAAADIPRILDPAQVADAAISTALGGANGTAVSVVAGREPVVQTHAFNDVPGFP